MTLDRIISKIRNEGLKGAAKAIGRSIHGTFSHPGYGKEVLTPILETIASQKKHVTIVQIGAHVGNTSNDPLHKFVVQHFSQKDSAGSSKGRAILVEPVKHLFDQLAANYRGIDGIRCVNAAIAEFNGTKTFYRFRDDVEPTSLGLPAYAQQLGSFDKNFLLNYCPHFEDPAQRDQFAGANIIATEVPCVTLMELLRQEGIEELDMLVVDTEGYDYQILKTLNFAEVAPAYINYEGVHLKRDQATCRSLMLDNGYALYDHGDDTLCTKNQKMGRFQELRERLYVAWLKAIF